MIRRLDDKAQIEGYAGRGATVIKSEARITGPGTLEAGNRTIHADHIIIATGSEPVIPNLEGAENVAIWTNRETFTATTLPERAVVIGGSAVGVESATFLSSFGTAVTLVHRGKRLMEREDPRVGELVRHYLQEAGVEVRLSTTAARAVRGGSASLLELDDGTSVGADVVIFATGRRPRTKNLGMDSVAVKVGSTGAVEIDQHCRAAGNVWAIGDVTGVMPFTHVAKYQGRIAADAILGRDRAATYQGIPRVVFGDPEIAAAGYTQAQADERGIATAYAELDLPESIARPWTYEREARGHLGLLTDIDRGILIGAWAVSPLAGEWIHQASLAIRARIPISVLRDQVAQFPTYSEAFQAALDKLRYRKED
jgi:dihydrolipoamide dehydrogenase